MRISESIGSDLKKAYSEELGKTNVISQGGLDAVIAANQFKNEIPENNKKHSSSFISHTVPASVAI